MRLPCQGENPVLLIDFNTTVSDGSQGSRVLLASDAFLNYTDPTASPDYTMTALIPEPYLSAGSITFENDEGELLVWRLSWGGAAYRGPTTGALTNDDDGDFGPPYDGPLPADGLAALEFLGTSSDLSTSNAADYVLTTGPATFTNNSGESFTVAELDCPNDPEGDADHDGLCGDVDNCPDEPNPQQADADSDGTGDACDACPEDPNKIEPGLCGCGVPDADSNGDGILDCESEDSNADDENDGPNGNQNPDGTGITGNPRFCGAGLATVLPVMLTGLCRWRTSTRFGRRPGKQA